VLALLPVLLLLLLVSLLLSLPGGLLNPNCSMYICTDSDAAMYIGSFCSAFHILVNVPGLGSWPGGGPFTALARCLHIEKALHSS
jgi:hypothetical protein